MMLQRATYKKKVDLSYAPWTMHKFFAGSGLVAYGLKGMFASIWANDISEQKAAVYEANFGDEHFELGDIKNICGRNLPFAHLPKARPLSLVVQFTRTARDKQFPLNSDDFQTSSKGQVAGLGGGNLKNILKEHGIMQQLSSEGGRTSRGSMGLMIKYVDFLNAWNAEAPVDFPMVEDFWAEQVREYFRNQPFILTADTSKTIGANLEELFEQAKKRQKQNPGTQYLGTVLQHLVAAKLCLIMPEGTLEIHGASVANGPTDRNGDFVINSTIIHCTTMPGALLIEKCISFYYIRDKSG